MGGTKAARQIEDYGMIGDTHSAALVDRDGAMEWLCLPRFDSGACLAALLGDADASRWRIAPEGDFRSSRRYRQDTLVLETDFHTTGGHARLIDFMPVRDGAAPAVVRRVVGLSGQVRLRSDLVPRFDYGSVVPWLRTDGWRTTAVAGPDGLSLTGDVPHDVRPGDRVAAEFTVSGGQSADFQLAWHLPRERPPAPLDVHATLDSTASWWRDWAGRCGYRGPYREPVVRSLITLKALVYAPSGGILAAPTTSLPEQFGGGRNWDYRYCWIRDATFTLLALLHAGYTREAAQWREWLLRAVAGRPEQMQIMYGPEGERRLTERELGWLDGFAGSRPVRAGNAASGQFQLDVYGELMDALHQARSHGVPPDDGAWTLQRRLMEYLESAWREPDNGIWEARGPRRHFTHSKVMAWVAADRAVRAVESFGVEGPADRWKQLRQDIADDVCEHGFDPDRNTFTQYYGSKELDAALLLMAPMGFLPASDPRIRGTVEAIDRELCDGGFVRRYAGTGQVDGLPPGEGAFLPCTFWLADNHILAGRADAGRAVFERLLGLRNDLGLLAEEYDVAGARLAGNFPQALSHLALVNTALDLADRRGPTQSRAGGG
jgi:GH15 family glucan-1,4-alpha-glucosidase